MTDNLPEWACRRALELVKELDGEPPWPEQAMILALALVSARGTVSEEMVEAAKEAAKLLDWIATSYRTMAKTEGKDGAHPEIVAAYEGSGQMAEDCAKRLTAALARPDGWQPMESAPKDGTRIMTWQPSWASPHEAILHWSGDRWVEDDGRWFVILPEYWRPLPAAPEPPK